MTKPITLAETPGDWFGFAVFVVFALVLVFLIVASLVFGCSQGEEVTCPAPRSGYRHS